jgi:Tropinone reductase 1
VNNAGTNIRKPSIEYTEEDIQKVFNTNLHSMMALTTACHPLLKRKKDEDSSSVINIGSVAGGTYRVLEILLLLWSRQLLTIRQSLA